MYLMMGVGGTAERVARLEIKWVIRLPYLLAMVKNRKLNYLIRRMHCRCIVSTPTYVFLNSSGVGLHYMC